MPVRVGRIIQISDLIRQAQAQGCEIRTSKIQLATPWGLRNIRFIHNPKTRGRYDISDYEDNEFMLESEISAVERRLSITLT